MIASKSLLGLLTGALLALASPAPLDRRAAVCNRDNCLRAVIASNVKPGSASASKDCASFLRKTVTPCAVPAVTNTIFNTHYLPTPTTIITEISTITADAKTELLTVVYTVTDATRDITTVVATETIQSTVSKTALAIVTAIETITEYLTTTQINYLPKPTLPIKREADGKRAIGDACVTGLVTPTAVPTYASACSGTVRYSSACSCNGLSEETVTADAPPAVTEVITEYKTFLPSLFTATETNFLTVVPTVTETSSLKVGVTLTNIVSLTATTILDPTTITVATSTSTEASTKTITLNVPGPTKYCYMHIRAETASGVAGYLYGTSSQVISVGAVNSIYKSIWRLDSAGKLFLNDGLFAGYPVSTAKDRPYVYTLSSVWISDYYGYVALKCVVNPITQAIVCSNGARFSQGTLTQFGPYLFVGQTVGTTYTLHAEPVLCVG